MNRKLAALAAFAVLFAASASAQLVVRVGMDLEGTYKTLSSENITLSTTTVNDDPDNYSDAHLGFTLSAEYLLDVERFMLLGAGFSFQIPRDLQSAASDRPTLSYLTPYATVRLPLRVEGVTMGPVGRIGFTFMLPDQAMKDLDSYDSIKPGIYWAAGLTMQLGSGLFADVVYSENRTSGEYTGAFDIVESNRYSAVEISLGYRF
ncbi:MAG: outer membrane beta-barrel protein [Spirochaetales bacterium]|nr:outer membrane beta-barrel protein [Spirochaetales bacterium]